ncbi:hypothetical protein AF332_12120 [Sporosarcina globispora]|uniref:Uncharacterized protein n=1 Tax=Sporosarcina globispora TaxID=1459 RepID=A0A0M0GC76_SPOGL|nr:hypothetical protein AF332_12120 [Sporosarcina globispora]
MPKLAVILAWGERKRINRAKQGEFLAGKERKRISNSVSPLDERYENDYPPNFKSSPKNYYSITYTHCSFTNLKRKIILKFVKIIEIIRKRVYIGKKIFGRGRLITFFP